MEEYHSFLQFHHWRLAPAHQYHLVLQQLPPVVVPIADDHEDFVDDFGSCKHFKRCYFEYNGND